MNRPMALLLAGVWLAACSRASEPQPLPAPAAPAPERPPVPSPPLAFAGRGVVSIADRPTGAAFQVELARSSDERNQGLMHRRDMADNAGMLFFMPGDDDWTFWMRNTYLRLDMVFIDRDWRVVGVLEDVPPLTEDHRAVGVPSRYVLELNAKVARRQGVTVGTRLAFREGKP